MCPRLWHGKGAEGRCDGSGPPRSAPLHRQGRLRAGGGGHDRGGPRCRAVAVPSEIHGRRGTGRRRRLVARRGGRSPVGVHPRRAGAQRVSVADDPGTARAGPLPAPLHRTGPAQRLPGAGAHALRWGARRDGPGARGRARAGRACHQVRPWRVRHDAPVAADDADPGRPRPAGRRRYGGRAVPAQPPGGRRRRGTSPRTPGSAGNCASAGCGCGWTSATSGAWWSPWTR